jgi:hypothetical protein
MPTDDSEQGNAGVLARQAYTSTAIQESRRMIGRLRPVFKEMQGGASV